MSNQVIYVPIPCSEPPKTNSDWYHIIYANGQEDYLQYRHGGWRDKDYEYKEDVAFYLQRQEIDLDEQRMQEAMDFGVWLKNAEYSEDRGKWWKPIDKCPGWQKYTKEEVWEAYLEYKNNKP